MSGTKRNLPNESYQAAIGANTPGPVNVYATIQDITGNGGNRIITGSASYSGVGFIYDVSALTYSIQGTLYSSLPTQVTLTAADPTDPRIDVILVNSLGVVSVLAGTPSPVPSKPTVDSLTEVEVTFVTVDAGTTTPTIVIEAIYAENAGTPTEWAGTTDGTVNFASTNDPHTGTVSVETTAVLGSNKEIVFTPLAPYTINGGQLSFWMNAKVNMSVSGSEVRVGFFNGGSLVGNSQIIGGTVTSTYGFLGSIVGTYQLVTIPIADFGGLPTTVDAIRFFKLGGPSTTNFFLDDVQVQEGVPTPPVLTAGHTILDETTPLTQRAKLAFQGAGVTATDDAGNDQTIVTIPGGGASSPIDESTGVLTGGILSAGTGGLGVATTFSIADGTGQVVTNLGVKTPVSWSGLTDIAITNLATNLLTFVGINSAGTVIQQTTPFTRLQTRSIIVLGVVVHVNLTNVDALNNQQVIAYNALSSVYDGMDSIGFFNVSGNVYSANGANLTLNKSVGIMFKMGSNYDTDVNNPHQRTLPALSALTFQYRYSNGVNGVTGANIDPDNLDNGAGGLTAVGVNKWSIQRIYSFTSNNVKIQRGIAEYNTYELALAGLPFENYVTEPSIAANGLLRGWLIVKQSSTVLNTTAQAVFISASKFGDSSGGGGGGAASTLQIAYNNSSSNPEILTDATNGPVTVRRGSAADTDIIYSGQNNAGADTFTVDGLGDVRGLNVKKANLVATSAPLVTSDTAAGYDVGSLWVDVTNDESYICVDATNGAAVWRLASGKIIEDEGTPQTHRPTMNFVGTGVTVTDSGGKTVVTIPGGGGGGTRSVQMSLGTIVSSGSASSGYILDSNEITYFINGANPSALKSVFLQFALPADYVSGGTFRFSSKKTGTVTFLRATAYINNVVDGTVNALSILPVSTGAYETTTAAFTTPKTAGDSINLEITFSGANGDNINFRNISFNYNA